MDRVVADESLNHEEDEVGVVEVDELGERAHQRLVVLHPPCRVHQHLLSASQALGFVGLVVEGFGCRF